MAETRFVTAFIKDLEEKDIEGLKKQTASEFQHRALRNPDALDSLDLLNLPTGQAKVLGVKEEGDRKLITVSVGEQEKKLLFELTKDPATGEWVVEDIRDTRKPKPGQTKRTLTEQMDLLIAIREFLATWESGNREQILGFVTESFSESLSQLPPEMLAKFTLQISKGIDSKSGAKPIVEGHRDTAFVKIKKMGNEITLTMRLEGDQWKTDDLRFVSRDEGDVIPSAKRQIIQYLTALRFLEAYQQGDKNVLAEMAHPIFFKRCIAPGDLQSVPLPILPLQEGEYEVRAHGTRAAVVTQTDREVVQFHLVEKGATEIDLLEDDIAKIEKATGPIEYEIEDVSIHDLEMRQEKRLSAMMTAGALITIFREALERKDIRAIQMASTTDFNERVWNKATPGSFIDVPKELLEPNPVEIVATRYEGAITHVLINYGSMPMTYVVRDQSGILAVDDLEIPAEDKPHSLKTLLSLSVPSRAFAAGWLSSKPEALREQASTEFRRAILNRLPVVPVLTENPAPLFRLPITKAHLSSERAIVTFGTEKRGARFYLVREGNEYHVDDILLMSPREKLGLKQQLKLDRLKDNSMIKKVGGASASIDDVPLDDPIDFDPTIRVLE